MPVRYSPSASFLPDDLSWENYQGTKSDLGTVQNAMKDEDRVAM
jgi:hypothetical protein